MAFDWKKLMEEYPEQARDFIAGTLGPHTVLNCKACRIQLEPRVFESITFSPTHPDFYGNNNEND